MLVANQIDFKIAKQKLTGSKCDKPSKTSKSVSAEKELMPTNGTLLAIKQMKEGNLPAFDSIKEMMDAIG